MNAGVFRIGSQNLVSAVLLALVGLLFSASSLAESRVVETAYGKVKIDGQPKRVVTLYEGALDASVAVGVTPLAALATRGGDGVASYIQPQVQGIAIVGTARELNLEAIVAQRPDLILASPQMKADQYRLLSSVAPTIVPATKGFLPENWKEESRLFARALGREELIESSIEKVESRAAAIAEKVRQRHPETELVANLVRWMPQGPLVMSSQLFSTGLIRAAGLEIEDAGLVKGGKPHSDPLSLENLARVDGDWMFLATLNAEGEAALTAAKRSPAFARLDVVKRDRVVPVDGQLWSSASGPIAAEAILDQLETVVLR